MGIKFQGIGFGGNYNNLENKPSINGVTLTGNKTTSDLGIGVKILNVVENGSLSRNGAVYSGFSASNYLQLGDKVDNGYLLYDNSVKDFGLAISSATSWEIVMKVIAQSHTDVQTLFGQNNSNPCDIFMGADNRMNAYFTNGEGLDIVMPSVPLDEKLGNDFIGKPFYLKVGFTGMQYFVVCSLDGENWLSGGNSYKDSPTKVSNRGNFVFGKHYALSDSYWRGSIDFSKTYIKINEQIWWKGVETL